MLCRSFGFWSSLPLQTDDAAPATRSHTSCARRTSRHIALIQKNGCGERARLVPDTGSQIRARALEPSPNKASSTRYRNRSLNTPKPSRSRMADTAPAAVEAPAVARAGGVPRLNGGTASRDAATAGGRARGAAAAVLLRRRPEPAQSLLRRCRCTPRTTDITAARRSCTGYAPTLLPPAGDAPQRTRRRRRGLRAGGAAAAGATATTATQIQLTRTATCRRARARGDAGLLGGRLPSLGVATGIKEPAQQWVTPAAPVTAQTIGQEPPAAVAAAQAAPAVSEPPKPPPPPHKPKDAAASAASAPGSSPAKKWVLFDRTRAATFLCTRRT